MYLTDLKHTYSKYFTTNTEDASSFLNSIDDSSLTFNIGLDNTATKHLGSFLHSSSNPNYDKGIFIHYLMEKYLLKYKLDQKFREETHAKNFCNPPVFELKEINENYTNHNNEAKQSTLAEDLEISDSDSNNDIIKTAPEIEKLINREFIRTYTARNKCRSCRKSFSCSSSLNRHLREKHRAHEPYICSICNKIYKRKDVLQKHISSCKNKNKRSKNFHCPYCSRKYGQKYNLSKHIRKCHKCNICNIAYKNLSDLKNHQCSRHDLKNMNIDKLDKSRNSGPMTSSEEYVTISLADIDALNLIG